MSNQISELKETKQDNSKPFEEVQDSVMFVNTNKKSEEEITEYFVAGFNKDKPDSFVGLFLGDLPTPKSNPFAYKPLWNNVESNFKNAEKNNQEVKYAYFVTGDSNLVVKIDNLFFTQINRLLNIAAHDSNGQVTYVNLYAVPETITEADFCTPYDIETRGCFIKMFKNRFEHEIRKFTVIPADKYPGINEELYEKYGWKSEMKSEHVFPNRDGSKREKIEFIVLSKRVIQFNNFPKTESNIDILTDLERIKGHKMGHIFQFLKETTCSEECRNANLAEPKISKFFCFVI